MSNLATLQPKPFKPGFDPRRVIPNNTGKEYEHSIEYYLKKWLLKGDKTLNGEEVTRLELIVAKLIEDAHGDVELVDRHRAANIVFDRLEGKALQRMDVTSKVALNINCVTDMTPEQIRALQPRLERNEIELYEQAGETYFRELIPPAEFTEIPETIVSENPETDEPEPE